MPPMPYRICQGRGRLQDPRQNGDVAPVGGHVRHGKAVGSDHVRGGAVVQQVQGHFLTIKVPVPRPSDDV